MYVYDQATGYGQVQEGTIIQSVVENSIAANLALQTDDIIKSIIINGQEYIINRYFEIGDILLTVRTDDVIAIKYVRDGNALQTTDYQVLSTDLSAIG